MIVPLTSPTEDVEELTHLWRDFIRHGVPVEAAATLVTALLIQERLGDIFDALDQIDTRLLEMMPK